MGWKEDLERRCPLLPLPPCSILHRDSRSPLSSLLFITRAWVRLSRLAIIRLQIEHREVQEPNQLAWRERFEARMKCWKEIRRAALQSNDPEWGECLMVRYIQRKRGYRIIRYVLHQSDLSHDLTARSGPCDNSDSAPNTQR